MRLHASHTLSACQHAPAYFSCVLSMPACAHSLLTHSLYAWHTGACTIYAFHSIYIHITIILWYCTSCVQVCNLKNFHGRKFTCNTTSVYKPTTTNNILFHIIKWCCISADLRYQHKRFHSLSTVLNLHTFVL